MGLTFLTYKWEIWKEGKIVSGYFDSASEYEILG